MLAAKILGAVDEEIKDIVFKDVTPHSLGVKTIGGFMSVIVPRNTSIPIIKQKAYTTSHDNQTVIELPIFQGER